MQTNLLRRVFLGRTAGGMLGSIAFKWLEAAERGQVAIAHHPPTAERVVVLFQNGGPSQMDLFDPRPELTRMNGNPFPGGVKVETLSPARSGNLLGSPFKFRPAGESGMLLSELIPNIASIADDITLVRSIRVIPRPRQYSTCAHQVASRKSRDEDNSTSFRSSTRIISNASRRTPICKPA